MLKNLSNRVSAKTIEETYTENDVERINTELQYNEDNKNYTVSFIDIAGLYNESTGFVFDYPMRWLNDRSDFKAIGIRRLKVIPSSHVFTLNICIGWNVKITATQIDQSSKQPIMQEGNPVTSTITKTYEYNFKAPISVIPENNLEEIMHNIINTFNNNLGELPLYDASSTDGELIEGNYYTWSKSAEPLSEYLHFSYSYDYREGTLSLKFDRNESVITIAQYAIKGPSTIVTANLEDLVSFLRFLNQDVKMDILTFLQDYHSTKSFANVWDRKSLQFHASFSDNKRNFIGLQDDFYDSPSVFYDPPTNASNFWIKFTTDGVHQIIPRYCSFYIGLCFVRNYKNSLVTK